MFLFHLFKLTCDFLVLFVHESYFEDAKKDLVNVDLCLKEYIQ